MRTRDSDCKGNLKLGSAQNSLLNIKRVNGNYSQQNFLGAHVCKVTIKNLPQPIISHTQSFETLGHFYKSHLCPAKYSIVWGIPGFFLEWNPNIFVNQDSMQHFRTIGQLLKFPPLSGQMERKLNRKFSEFLWLLPRHVHQNNSACIDRGPHGRVHQYKVNYIETQYKEVCIVLNC